MTLTTKSNLVEMFCSRCGNKSFINPRIYHEDPANGEVNPLVWHCTFCTEILE